MPNDLGDELRGFGPIAIFAIVVIVLAHDVAGIPLGALLVLAWVNVTRTPWREIGYVPPKSWVGTVVVGMLFGVAFKFAMKALVMPLLGADPVNQPYHYLAGNRATLPGAIWLMIVVAGFGEETVFRGFLFERLRKLFGSSTRAKTLIVLGSALLFGLGHLADQGIAGMEQAVVTGTVFGTIFMLTGRIWFVMVAHAAFDLAALALIYWDVEAAVAHAVFR